MNIDNPSIVLIAIYTQKNDQDMVSFKQLQEILPLERSHISQALAYNEQKNFIKKPEKKAYFSTIQITQSGILQAERYANFLSKLLQTHKSPPRPEPKKEEEKKKPPNTSEPSLNIKLFLDNLSSTFFSPLKDTLKNSLEDYIPKSHLNDNLLDDLTDAILNFFYDHLSTI